LPEGEWTELGKAMKKAIRKVKEESHCIEDVSGKNDSDTDHMPDEEETNESDGLSKKKKKNLYLEYWMKVLEDEINLFSKATASSLDKNVFSESGNKKIRNAEKAAKCKVDNDFVLAFQEDVEVNKKCLVIADKRLALEVEKNNNVNCAVQNDIIYKLHNDHIQQLETIRILKKDKQSLSQTERNASNDSRATRLMKKALPMTVQHHCSNNTLKNKGIFVS
jgi:hypothetical protein